MSLAAPPVRNQPRRARAGHPLFAAPAAPADLKRNTVQGVAATLGGQATVFVLGIGSTAVLARLLTPADFGLVAMTAAFTGFATLLSDGGLGAATVQREHITHAQVSTLFWINAVLGLGLAGALFLAAPLIALLYGEARVADMTRVLAVAFVLTGLTVQHRALMRRQFRFRTLATLDVVAMAAGVVVAIALAAHDVGPWALVGMAVTLPLVAVVALWAVVPWRPSSPRRHTDVRPFLRFGGDMVSYNVVTYLKSQADLMLIGWRWGPLAVGLYEKAYRMLLLPLRQVNGPLGAVVIPALCRMTGQPDRFSRFFSRALELLLGATIPIVFALALFADQVVYAWLGAQWTEAARLFRLLSLAAVVGALVSPVAWLLVSLGRTRRHKWIGITTSATHVVAFLAGLPFGPGGVAVAYSISNALLLVPVWVWALRGTPVRGRTILRASGPCVAASAPALLVGFVLLQADALLPSPALRTALAAAAYGLVYAAVLFAGFGRWQIYRDVVAELRQVRRPERAAATGPVTAPAQDIPVFVINLERDARRLRATDANLRRAGFGYARVAAVDGPACWPRLRRLLRRGFYSRRLNRPLTPGEIGCGLSHLRALREVVHRDLPHAVILEDDVAVSPAFTTLLRHDLARLLGLCDVIKLEGIRDQRSSRSGLAVAGSAAGSLFVPLRPALGSAGYAVNARGARRLLATFKRLDRPVDHLLAAYDEHGARYAEFEHFPVYQTGEVSNIRSERQEIEPESRSWPALVARRLRQVGTGVRRIRIIMTMALRRFSSRFSAGDRLLRRRGQPERSRSAPPVPPPIAGPVPAPCGPRTADIPASSNRQTH